MNDQQLAAVKQALGALKKGTGWMEHGEIIAALHSIISHSAQPAPVQEPVAWVDLLKKAEEVVRSKSLWKKYIDGTPLANDIAVWMVNFAQEHTTPPAPQPVPVKTYHDGKPWPVQPKPWVGLTDEEFIDLCEDACNFGTGSLIRHIEAKLKEKNT